MSSESKISSENEETSIEEMSRDMFIQEMISALSHVSTKNDPLFQKMTPIRQKSAHEVFQTLCYDFPVYKSEDLVMFRTSLSAWVDALGSNARNDLTGENIGFYYNEIFLSNVFSLSSNIMKKSDSLESSTEEGMFTQSDNDPQQSAMEITLIYSIALVTIPKKILSQERDVWIQLFREDDSISWRELLFWYRRLIQSISHSILSHLGSNEIQKNVLPSLCYILDFFSSIIRKNESTSQSTLKQYLAIQLNQVNDFTQELSEECQDVVDCIKDLITTLTFLIRDIFSELPDLMSTSNLRSVLTSIDPTTTQPVSSSLSLQELRPSQHLVLSFLYGNSNYLLLSLEKPTLSTKRSLLLKSLADLQIVLLSQLSLIVNMAEYLSKGTGGSHSADYWRIVLELVKVLLYSDNLTNPRLQSSIHDKLIGSRLVSMIVDLWIAISAPVAETEEIVCGMNVSMAKALIYRLAEVIVSLCRHVEPTIQYISSIPGFTRSLSVLGDVYKSNNTECVDPSVTESIAFWLCMSSISLPGDIDAIAVLQSSMDASLATIKSYLLSRNSDANESASEGTDTSNQELRIIESQRHRIISSIQSCIRLVQDHSLRIFTGRIDLSARQISAMNIMKTWIQETLLALNSRNAKDNSNLDHLRKSLKDLKGMLEGNVSSKVD